MTAQAAEWPQPHEGIRGQDYVADDLLSLEPAALPRRRLIVDMAACQRTACLVGNQAPVVARMWGRMSHPVPGDLVVETTSFVREGIEVEGFGLLLAHRMEWASSDAGWAEYCAGEPDHGDRRAEDAWYVQYGPKAADVCRWVNADFAAILRNWREFW